MTQAAHAERTEQVDPHGVDSMRVLPESFDPAQRTFEVVMSTGAAVRRYSWRTGPYDEKLSVEPGHVRLDRAQSGRMPLLLNHWQWDVDQVVGNVVENSVRFEEEALVGLIRLHETEKGEEIMQRIRRGELPNFSVGYRTHVHETIEHEDGPDQRTAVDWELVELSVVPIPADAGAHTRSASDGATCVVRSASDTTMAKTTDGKPAAKGSETPDQTRAANEGDGTPAPPAAPAASSSGGGGGDSNRSAPQPEPSVDLEAARKQGAEDERKRSAGIRDIVSRTGLSAELADDLIERGLDLQGARDAVLEEIASTRGGEEIDGRVGDIVDAEVKSRQAIERAILHRADPRAYKLEDGDDARNLVGDSLLELGVRRMGMLGHSVGSLGKNERASAVMNTGSSVRGLHGISDFPVILANVVGKRLRDSYRGIARSYEAIVTERTVTDFKEITAVQLGAASKLEQVGEHGEYTRGTIGEAGEKYAIDTYGKVLPITRRTIINDDLDALSRIPMKMGQQAALLEARLVWSILGSNPLMGDGLPLFHVNHGNVVTGGLDAAGLDAAYVAMRLHTDLDGETEIELMPSTVIVPVELANQARRELVLQTVPTETSMANPFRGTMQVVDTAHLSKFSASDYYVAASTSQVDIIELAFLAGNREPYFETRDGFDVDGTEIKVRHELGAKAIDWRGLVKVA